MAVILAVGVRVLVDHRRPNVPETGSLGRARRVTGDWEAVVSVLDAICRDAIESVECYGLENDVDLAETYAQLRGKAQLLNERHGWATAEEFRLQFPTPSEQANIETMNRQFEGWNVRSDVEPGGSIERLLRRLSAWSTGVAMVLRTSDRRL